MAYIENKQVENEEIWYIDYGYNNNMTCNKNLICDLNEIFWHNVKLLNGSRMSFMGKGSVKVQMNKIMQTIDDVYYVPKLKSKLISLWQLQEIGYAIVFYKGSCQIHDLKEGLIFDVKMFGNHMV